MKRKRRKSWRCFHCDQVFRSRRAAFLHFGDDAYEAKDVPACVDPLRTDEVARMKELREAQAYTLRCQEAARIAEDKLDNVEREFAEFKAVAKCRTINELRDWMDTQQGRLVTAEALISGFRKADPALAERIIG